MTKVSKRRALARITEPSAPDASWNIKTDALCLSPLFFSSSLLPFPFFFFIPVGWLIGPTQNSAPVPREPRRSQNSTTFFSIVESSTKAAPPGERPVFLAKLFLSRLPGTFLEGGEERMGDNLYHPGAATRNGFCLREGEIIFCCKSMDPRVFNQILRFFVRGGGYGGKDELDLNGFRLG